MWHISVRSLWQRRCLLTWCSCRKKMGQVFVRLQRLYLPWSCMCSAMHIDLCALNWYGCLLVALDISVLINATIYKFSARRQDFLMLMYRAFFFFFYRRLHATGKCILSLLFQILNWTVRLLCYGHVSIMHLILVFRLKWIRLMYVWLEGTHPMQ